MPVIVNDNGYKLSKQTLAAAVDIEKQHKTLFDLLVLLKQKPPDTLTNATVNEMLEWAIANWQTDSLYSRIRLEVK